MNNAQPVSFPALFSGGVSRQASVRAKLISNMRAWPNLSKQRMDEKRCALLTKPTFA